LVAAPEWVLVEASEKERVRVLVSVSVLAVVRVLVLDLGQVWQLVGEKSCLISV
jgi:hypothetical protein